MSPYKFDEFLERQTTKVCHAIQRWTGISSYLVAHFLTGLWTISLIVLVASKFFSIPDYEKPSWGDIAFCGLLLACSAILLNRTRIAHDKLMSGFIALPSWLAFFRDSSSRFSRLVCVSLVILEIPIDFLIKTPVYWPLHNMRSSGFFCYTACQYVLLVNPLPPGTNKVKEFLNSFIPKGVPIRS